MIPSDNGSSISSHDKEVLKQIFSQGLNFDDDDSPSGDANENELAESECDIQAKELELRAVASAERGDSAAALELCNQAIAIAPNRASTYNNRAQVLRIKGDIEGALNDLGKAIELSHERGQVACQAFTQRGLIKIRNEDREAAKVDLQKAADLGNNYAKQVLAAMNPYAALCNQMLGEVIGKLRSGDAES